MRSEEEITKRLELYKPGAYGSAIHDAKREELIWVLNISGVRDNPASTFKRRKTLRELEEGDIFTLRHYDSARRDTTVDLLIVLESAFNQVTAYNVSTAVTHVWDLNMDNGDSYMILSQKVAELVSRFA